MNTQSEHGSTDSTTTSLTTEDELARATAHAIRECKRNPAMTLRELWNLWWTDYAVPRLSSNSRCTYNSVFTKHLLPYLGEVQVGTLTEFLVHDFIEGRYAEVGFYRRITPWVLKAVLSKAVLWGLIDTNPVMEIDALFLGGKPSGLADKVA
jgi:hypothetical protein